MSIPDPMRVLLLGALVLVAGCNSAPDDAAAGDEAGSMPVEDTVFDDTVGTMDRARSVEDTVLEEKQELDRAIDEAGGG